MIRTFASFIGSALRSFIIMFCGTCGIVLAFAIIAAAIYGLTEAAEDELYSSKVKLLPDAQGNRKKLSASAPVILQINISGTIGTDKLTGEEIEEILLDTREDIFKERQIHGILLVINSPGGDVNDSDLIYRFIKHYKEQYKVPVFAFADGLCASGGYYIACAADKIYASEVSVIGSIGVLSWPPFVNVVDAMEKIGVNALTLSAGQDKDQLNPFRRWKPNEQEHYQQLMNFFYERFVDIVAHDRPIQKEMVINTLGAKVFPAPEALKLGLIDHCCSSRAQALEGLAKSAGIETEYQVVQFETKSWWKKWIQEKSQSPIFTGKIVHEFALPQTKHHPFSYIFIS